MNYKSDLVNNILPFWLKDAIDYKNGGIYTCLDKKGNIYGTDKSVWFQGRALWVFSKAYNCIEKNEEYLNAAKNIYKFLEKCTDTDGRMFFTVTEDGRELQKRELAEDKPAFLSREQTFGHRLYRFYTCPLVLPRV